MLQNIVLQIETLNGNMEAGEGKKSCLISWVYWKHQFFLGSEKLENSVWSPDYLLLCNIANMSITWYHQMMIAIIVGIMSWSIILIDTIDDLCFGLWFLDILIKICYSFGIFDHFHLNQSNSKPYVKDCWFVLIKIWKVLSNIFNRMAALHMFCKRKVYSGTKEVQMEIFIEKVIFEMTH